MEVKTVVVSSYPMFKEGLKKILGPSFDIISCFNDVSELLTAEIELELAILDEPASKDFDLLRQNKPDITILKLSLDDNVGRLSKCVDGSSNERLTGTIQSLKDKLPVYEIQS